MRIKVQKIGDGAHHSESVVEIKTTGGGVERLVIATRSLQNNSILVGAPLGHKGKEVLVELPREAMSGTSRVWVSSKNLLEDEARVA
ncbi:MAG TPA: hypothetical protein VII49_14190 [Rhizomicrobium sp.]